MREAKMANMLFCWGVFDKRNISAIRMKEKCACKQRLGCNEFGEAPFGDVLKYMIYLGYFSGRGTARMAAPQWHFSEMTVCHCPKCGPSALSHCDSRARGGSDIDGNEREGKRGNVVLTFLSPWQHIFAALLFRNTKCRRARQSK